jgi:hypothetical protein
MVDPANLQGWYDLRKSLKIGIASALKLGYIGTFRNVSMNFGKKKLEKNTKPNGCPSRSPKVFQIWVCLRKKGTANPLYIH